MHSPARSCLYLTMPCTERPRPYLNLLPHRRGVSASNTICMFVYQVSKYKNIHSFTLTPVTGLNNQDFIHLLCIFVQLPDQPDTTTSNTSFEEYLRKLLGNQLYFCFCTVSVWESQQCGNCTPPLFTFIIRKQYKKKNIVYISKLKKKKKPNQSLKREKKKKK